MLNSKKDLAHQQKINLQESYFKFHNILIELTKCLQQQYLQAIKQLQIGNCYVNMGIIKQITQHILDLQVTVDLGIQSGNIYTIPSNLIHQNYQDQSIFDIDKFIKQSYGCNSVTLDKKHMQDYYIQKISQQCPDLFVIILKSDSFSQKLKIDDADITKLTLFKNLSSLSLRFSYILDDSIQFLSTQNFPNLKQLDISGCQLLTDQSIRYLSGDKYVTIKLNYINTISQDAFYNLITRSNNLNYLELKNCQDVQYNQFPYNVADIYGKDTSNLKWIQITTNMGIDLYANRMYYLTAITSCETMTDSDVRIILGDIPQIDGIYFNQCQQLTISTLQLLIQKCPKLKRLKLQKFIKLNDSLVHVLSTYLINLQYLDLSKCFTITNSSLIHIGNSLKKLTRLILENCRSISDQGIIQICQYLPNLITINLQNCKKITDQSIFKIGKCLLELRSLNISYCDQVTDDSISFLSEKLTKLHTVLFNYCGLSDSSISLLAIRLKGLKRLEIQWCPVSQKCIEYIANMTELTHLNLSYCPSVCDQQALIMSKKLKKLKSLRLQSCDKLSSSILSILGISFPYLQQLTLKQCSKVDDSTIKQFSTHCPNLNFIDLSWCSLLTNKSLFAMGQYLHNLQHLKINGCSSITDQGIIWLSSSLSLIQYLNLTLCQNLTDQSVISISKKMAKLKVLYLCQLKKITDISVSLLSNLQSLSELHLSGCIQITNSSLTPLFHNLPQLTCLNINQCHLITIECLKLLASTLHNLRILQVSQLSIDDQFLYLIGTNLNKLTFINISHCHQISDKAVIKLMQSVPSLIRIDIQRTNLQDNTKKIIFQSLTLRKLHKVVTV